LRIVFLACLRSMVKSPWSLQAAEIISLGHCIFFGKAVRRVIKRERRVEEMTDAKSGGVKTLREDLSPRRTTARRRDDDVYRH
jgi:hypothetical protein